MPNAKDDEIFRFIVEEIDSVPELEALLLLRQQRSTFWSPVDLANRLYIQPEQARALLAGLIRKQFAASAPGEPEMYRYETSEERDVVIGGVEQLYRRETVRISTLIHNKPSAAIRDFARAFRFTKEK